MTTDNFCFYLQNRLIQTSQTGGHWYSDTSPFSIPWFILCKPFQPCIILVSKAGAEKARLERILVDKHSSLFGLSFLDFFTLAPAASIIKLKW
jgi:hypothetical protein